MNLPKGEIVFTYFDGRPENVVACVDINTNEDFIEELEYCVLGMYKEDYLSNVENIAYRVDTDVLINSILLKGKKVQIVYSKFTK